MNHVKLTSFFHLSQTMSLSSIRSVQAFPFSSSFFLNKATHTVSISLNHHLSVSELSGYCWRADNCRFYHQDLSHTSSFNQHPLPIKPSHCLPPFDNLQISFHDPSQASQVASTSTSTSSSTQSVPKPIRPEKSPEDTCGICLELPNTYYGLLCQSTHIKTLLSPFCLPSSPFTLKADTYRFFFFFFFFTSSQTHTNTNTYTLKSFLFSHLLFNLYS